MKLPVNWQNLDHNVHPEDLDQLAAFQQELPRRLSGTGQRPSKILGVLLKTLCQKNQGNVTCKQKTVTVGNRTTYGALSPERTSFQNGIDGWHHW
jgi:hypothetical protein